MSDDALPLGKTAETHGKSNKNWCALDGSWIYQLVLQMQGKNFLSTSEEEFAAEKVVANAEIGVSASRRLCERPLFRCRLQDKRLCDEHGQTVSIKMSFLVKDTVPS